MGNLVKVVDACVLWDGRNREFSCKWRPPYFCIVQLTCFPSRWRKTRVGKSDSGLKPATTVSSVSSYAQPSPTSVQPGGSSSYVSPPNNLLSLRRSDAFPQKSYSSAATTPLSSTLFGAALTALTFLTFIGFSLRRTNVIESAGMTLYFAYNVWLCSEASDGNSLWLDQLSST